ncbi:hypothetical protein [Ekhidna sp.]|uniref:hypothetical protein n=1 Tax=Ekhidna sp. TaxID=2608089 RepID=UPI003B4FFDED
MMINRKLKWFTLIAFIILFLGYILLKILFQIGINNGVKVVDLPSQSKISQLIENADYVDAYEIGLNEPIDQNKINAFAASLGDEYFKNENEMIVKGTAPGLTFFASFYKNSENRLTLSTVVFYENLMGMIYFTPVKIVHKNGLPYFLYKEFSKSEP